MVLFLLLAFALASLSSTKLVSCCCWTHAVRTESITEPIRNLSRNTLYTKQGYTRAKCMQPCPSSAPNGARTHQGMAGKSSSAAAASMAAARSPL